MRYGFEELGLHRMEAAIVPRNAKSRRVAAKLGLRDEGTATRFLQIQGTWEDHVRYAITREEWDERRQEFETSFFTLGVRLSPRGAPPRASCGRSASTSCSYSYSGGVPTTRSNRRARANASTVSGVVKPYSNPVATNAVGVDAASVAQQAQHLGRDVDHPQQPQRRRARAR